ncbi:MAG: hypothetical protein M1827_000295 [Pycnora praestabilis]|nr:MAG: hypothetical protein M1827_000295 [Pycnora praestabilis]
MYSLVTLVCLALASVGWTLSFQQRNFDTISKIYNVTVYPNNLDFIANGSAAVPPGLFNTNATGRISPIGNFSGFQDSVEYFFALAPTAQPPSYSVFSKAQVVEFTSGCPEVAASVVYFTELGGPLNNQQYVTTLKQKPFGDWDELWGDDIVCREVHIELARIRPAVHCPHVGPTGGGKCVNEPYNQGYFDDQALFGKSEGQNFMCGNSWQ